MRNKKIIGILICMLLIATAVPLVESLKNSVAINSIISSSSQTSIVENWTQLQKLLASDGAAGYDFGYSVSISGDTALIGAPGYDSNMGAVYVFTRTGTTWTQQQKLLDSDHHAEDVFGYSVSLSGNTALIGAAGYNISVGSAYVFTRTGTTWNQQAKLLASDGAGDNYFGWSVSLSGDTALIGAPGVFDFHDPHLILGYAYVFTRTGTSWAQQAKLLASDGVMGALFGCSVSLSGDTALIGAPYYDSLMGSAYVFTRTGITWTQQQKLLASDGAANDEFGNSVSLSGDTALIGAPDYDSSIGSAYVFTRTGTTWTQQQKLLDSDHEATDVFGYSVSLSGNTALIGAAGYNISVGSAYVFTRTGTTWAQEAKLLASDGAGDNYFGWSVSLSGDTALIGTFEHDNNIGAAYVFIKGSPNPPTITGPAKGKVGKTTNYIFTTTDPLGDQIYYYIDWGDGQISVWIGPCASGAAQTISHTWSTKGTYTVKAKAKDIHGAESGWTTLVVSMPKDKGINLIFAEFLQKLFQRFPFFEKILNQYYD